MKNGIGLKSGMTGIILVPLRIFNNHNPSEVFAQGKANANSILIAMDIRDIALSSIRLLW